MPEKWFVYLALSVGFIQGSASSAWAMGKAKQEEVAGRATVYTRNIVEGRVDIPYCVSGITGVNYDAKPWRIDMGYGHVRVSFPWFHTATSQRELYFYDQPDRSAELYFMGENWVEAGPGGYGSACEINYTVRRNDADGLAKTSSAREFAGVSFDQPPTHFTFGHDILNAIHSLVGSIAEAALSPVIQIQNSIENGVNWAITHDYAGADILQPFALTVCEIELKKIAQQACSDANIPPMATYNERIRSAYENFLNSLQGK